MWMEQDPLCTSPDGESGPLANNAPLTVQHCPLELLYVTGESTFLSMGSTVLAQEMGRSQEQRDRAHGTVWIVVQGRLLRCGPEHLRSTETETWRKLERSQTLHRTSNSRRVHTLIFEASPILLMGQSRDISVERFL